MIQKKWLSIFAMNVGGIEVGDFPVVINITNAKSTRMGRAKSAVVVQCAPRLETYAQSLNRKNAGHGVSKEQPK